MAESKTKFNLVSQLPQPKKKSHKSKKKSDVRPKKEKKKKKEKGSVKEKSSVKEKGPAKKKRKSHASKNTQESNKLESHHLIKSEPEDFQKYPPLEDLLGAEIPVLYNNLNDEEFREKMIRREESRSRRDSVRRMKNLKERCLKQSQRMNSTASEILQEKEKMIKEKNQAIALSKKIQEIKRVLKPESIGQTVNSIKQAIEDEGSNETKMDSTISSAIIPSTHEELNEELWMNVDKVLKILDDTEILLNGAAERFISLSSAFREEKKSVDNLSESVQEFFDDLLAKEMYAGENQISKAVLPRNLLSEDESFMQEHMKKAVGIPEELIVSPFSVMEPHNLPIITRKSTKKRKI